MIRAPEQAGKIHRETELAANARTGFVFAGDKSKSDGKAAAHAVLTADHALKLGAGDAGPGQGQASETKDENGQRAIAAV